jgi:hypothetical protein
MSLKKRNAVPGADNNVKQLYRDYLQKAYLFQKVALRERHLSHVAALRTMSLDPAAEMGEGRPPDLRRRRPR